MQATSEFRRSGGMRLVRLGLLAWLGALAQPGLTVAVAAPVAPASDPFYVAPADLASDAPGTILRERQVTVTGPEAVDTSAVYQLLYRTTNAKGQPVATATTLMLPAMPAAGPRNLVSYQTAYDSLTLNCAPSYTLQGGNSGGGTTATAETNLIGQELQQGWDVVVPDYEGPQNEWAVGPMLGRATLDSVKAVESFAPAEIEGSATQVAMNGYSGGSEATTWAAAFVRSYAPSVHLVGIAVGGNFPDPGYTLTKFDGSLWYGTEIGVMVSINRAYPEFDLDAILNAKGQALAAQDGMDAGGCGASTLNEPGGNASQFTNYPSSPAIAAIPRVKQVLDEMNLNNAPVMSPPSFVYNATGDELAHIAPVDAWVAEECRRGATIDYDRDPAGSEHVTGLTVYWPQALLYLEQRFAGASPPDTCPPGSSQGSSGSATTATTTPAASVCPVAARRLGTGALGRARLGMTRAQVRRAYRGTVDRRGRYQDAFCPQATGIRVGIPTVALLRSLAPSARRRLRGRIDWILTGDPAYSLRGLRPGSTVSDTGRARLGRAYGTGGARWYLLAEGRVTGLAEVRRGVIVRVGIANRALTRSPLTRRLLIASL